MRPGHPSDGLPQTPTWLHAELCPGHVRAVGGLEVTGGVFPHGDVGAVTLKFHVAGDDGHFGHVSVGNDTFGKDVIPARLGSDGPL